MKNGLLLQPAEGVTQFRVTQMWQERDFHFCLLISQQGLSGPSSHPPPSFPYLNIVHKRDSDKKPQNLRPNPSYTGLSLTEKLALWTPILIHPFSFCLPRPENNLLPETAAASPGVMEGKIPLFRVPVSLGVQKHCFPISTSAAQLHFRANHNMWAKIDLPLKVSEETQMAISYATALHVCIYSNVPAQRKIYMRSVFMSLSNVRTNHPHCSRTGSPPICVMTSHLTLDLHLCLC